MRFYALISDAGDSLVAEFPDCPGCVAVAGPREDVGRNAAAVLRSWLESLLLTGGLPPLPSPKPPGQGAGRVRAVPVPDLLALRIQARHYRHLNGWTTRAFASSLGVPEPQVTRLEHPAGEPSARTVERVRAALGLPSDARQRSRAILQPAQTELFPPPHSGRIIRLAELSALEVGIEEAEVEFEVALSIPPALLDRMQAAATASGRTLGEWMVEAGRARLRREAMDSGIGGDERQQTFGFDGQRREAHRRDRASEPRLQLLMGGAA